MSPVMTKHTRKCSDCGGTIAPAGLKEGDKVKIIDGGPLKTREGQTATATGKAAPTLKVVSCVMEQKYEVEFAPGINLWYTLDEMEMQS